jgi:hypothetical protein
MTQPPILPGFVGWHRKDDGRSPWESVCEAPTSAECWRKLIAYKPRLVPRCEKIVKPKGVKP